MTSSSEDTSDRSARSVDDRSLREIVASEFPHLDEEEVGRYTESAMRWVHVALGLERGTIDAAAEAMGAGLELVDQSRALLATGTQPGIGPVIRGPWQTADRRLQHVRQQVERHPGVVGSTLAIPRDGQVENAKVRVYVERKKSLDELAAAREDPLPPAFETPDGSISVEVAELGRIEPYLAPGWSLGPFGTRVRGTIGAFAVETATQDIVALTAMHVTERNEIPPEGRLTFTAPAEVDEGLAPVLGDVVRGTRTNTDAAMIRVLDPSAVNQEIEGIGPIRGWRPIVVPDDQGTVVRMRGAATGRVVRGQILEPSVHLSDPPLLAGILVDIPAIRGDSGAAILDSRNLVLGLLVGAPSAETDVRVFAPISLALQALGCEIPTAT